MSHVLLTQAVGSVTTTIQKGGSSRSTAIFSGSLTRWRANSEMLEDMCPQGP